MTIFYVNTDDQSAGEYASLALAEAALPTILDDAYAIECTGVQADESQVLISGFTVDVVNNKTLLVKPSQYDYHNGVWSNLKYRLTPSSDSAVLNINNYQDGVEINCLQLGFSSSSSASYKYVLNIGEGDYNIISRCFIKNLSSESFRYGCRCGSYADNNKFLNNIIIGFHTAGIYNSYGDTLIANNSIFKCEQGIRTSSGGNPLIYNNICLEKTGSVDFNIAYGVEDYNISSDASVLGAHSLTNKSYTDVFTDADNGDLTLKSGSPAIGAGTDLSAYFTIDIIGTTRSTWDIGAFAYSPSGGTPITNYFDIRAAVANSVTSLSDSIARISNAITSNADSRAGVSNIVSSSADSHAGISNSIVSAADLRAVASNQLLYLFDTLAQIGNQQDVQIDFDTLATISNQIGSSADVQGVISNAITKAFDSRVSVSNQVTATVDLLAEIRRQLGVLFDSFTVISNQVTTSADLAASIHSDLILTVDTAATVSNTISLSADLQASISTQIEEMFDTRAQILNENSIQVSFDTLAKISNQIVSTADLSSEISNAVITTADVKAAISQLVQQTADSQASISRQLTETFDTAAIISGFVQVVNLFDTFVSVSNQLSVMADTRAVIVLTTDGILFLQVCLTEYQPDIKFTEYQPTIVFSDVGGDVCNN